jgi:anti-anti-sigma regulatory factor
MAFCTALAICRKLASNAAANRLFFRYLQLGLQLPLRWGCEVGEEPHVRITKKTNGQVVFKVSGQLTAENVAEMEAFIAAEGKGERIVLDCMDLRSVDGEAVKFLEKWAADSIKLKNCGLYIRERIKRQRQERKSGEHHDT